MFRIVSLSVMLTLIVILGITFFKVVAPYLLPLFLAGVVAILAQPLFHYFIRRTKGRIRLASGITTSVIMAAILLPMVVATALAALQLYTFALQVGQGESWNAVLVPRIESAADEELEAGSKADRLKPYDEQFADFVNKYLPEDSQIDHQKVRAEVASWLKDQLNNLGGRTLGLVKNALFSAFSLVISLLIFAVALYYFFADGTLLLESTEALIPVHVEYQRQLLSQFAAVVRSVVLATFFAALAQAVATTLALWLLGFGHLIMLFILCLLASLIPMAGAWLIWAPCALILIQQGQIPSAIFLSLYGMIFVGMLDNVVRPYILNNSAKLHPLLALISVLGGIQVMGLWGVFIGPIVASCLHALVKIFNHELIQLSKETFSGEKPNDAPSGQTTGPKNDSAPEQTAKPKSAATKAEDASASESSQSENR